MSYPGLNWDIGNPLTSGAEVGIALWIVVLHFWHNFFGFRHFVNFLNFDNSTLKNHAFTNLIDVFKCNNEVLKLPRVNTLCDNYFCDVMNQFPKSEGWVILTSLHSRFHFRFWWNNSLAHGFDRWGWEKFVWSLYLVNFQSFHRGTQLDVVVLIRDTSVISVRHKFNEWVVAILMEYPLYGILT